MTLSTPKPLGKKIEPINLSMYYDDGDSVTSNLCELEEKLNEVIEAINQQREDK